MTVYGPEEGQQYASSGHALLESRGVPITPSFDQRWDQDVIDMTFEGIPAAQYMSGNMKMMPDKQPGLDTHETKRKQMENRRDINEEPSKTYRFIPPGTKTPKGYIVDREHDVPLLAAALDDGNGFYGIAVDRRIPKYHTNEGITYDPSQFVYHHEQIEHADMTENGTPYQQAHDEIATPYEKDHVTEFAKANGVDPEKFWKNHQQFWTAHLDKANAQPPEQVHPHTYLKPYEDSNHKYKDQMLKLAQYGPMGKDQTPFDKEETNYPGAPQDDWSDLTEDRYGRLVDTYKLSPKDLRNFLEWKKQSKPKGWPQAPVENK